MIRSVIIPFDLLAVETLYGLAILAICVILYTKINEFYSLTNHKGFLYFKNIFLFFGLAYVIRVFYIFFIYILQDIISARVLLALSLFSVTYFSNLAFFSIILMLVYRRIPAFIQIPFVFYSGIGLLSLTILLTRSHLDLIALQTAVMAVAMVGLLFYKKKGSNFLSQNKITFLLLMFFWVITVIPFGKNFLSPVWRIPIYMLSLSVFAWIYYRIEIVMYNGKKKR